LHIHTTTIFKWRKPLKLGEKLKFLHEEAGVEPTALKIMAGVILLGIGLGIGVAVYKTVGRSVTAMQVTVSPTRSSTTIGRPASGENDNTDSIQVDVTLIMGTAEDATLSATGQPSGVTVTFSTLNVGYKPPFYSTMTVSVSSTASLGTYTLTILAKTSGGATSGSAPFNLTIS
jgi:hypothetical protein